MSAIRKTITVSAEQDAWIKQRTAAGVFTNDSEYIRDLVNRDREARDQLTQLRAAIAEGLESGVSDMTLDDIWNEAETRAANA